MKDIHERLVACFRNVFPNVEAEEAPRASTASLAAWDSLAHITLLSAISEEFGVDFSDEDFEELVSFALIADRLSDAPTL
jgi:acyl carrier protein